MSGLPPDELELSKLCAVMAHDLKNPLAALMTNLHFLEDGPVSTDPEHAEALGDSVMLCEVLERYMKNLDLLGRAPGAADRRFLSAIGQVVTDVAKRLEKQANAAQVVIVSELDGGIAFVDREMFSRALENILANAVESAPRSSKIKVTMTSTPAEVTVSVADARLIVPDGEGRGTKEMHARYGRGLSLFCANMAAQRCGARLEVGGSSGAFVVRLSARAKAEEGQ